MPTASISEVRSNPLISVCAECKEKASTEQFMVIRKRSPSLNCALGRETNLKDTLKDLLSHKAAGPEPPGRVGTLAISLAICLSGSIFSELLSMLMGLLLYSRKIQGLSVG